MNKFLAGLLILLVLGIGAGWLGVVEKRAHAAGTGRVVADDPIEVNADGGPPSQPTQPLSGPGGPDYASADWVVSSGGNGDDAWYVFQPTSPMPASAPLVIMLHGYYEFSGYDSLYQFIRHEVLKGNVVVYPRWQTATATPCPGPYNIEPCIASALNGINGGIAWLQADPANRVQPELDKTSYFGFSFGGIITANLANRYASLGLPEPKVLFLAEPHDGGLTGPGEPALDASLAGIPSTTLVNCLNGDQGVITEVGKSASSCNAVFPKLGHIPDANKDIVLANSDAHGEPQIIANHPMCAATASDPLSLDALDFFACWKILDGLRDCAFSGTNCEYALDDTPEHRFMGLWSDGVPVSELKIQKAAPIAPNDGDGDGCLDVRELGPSHATGGQRDPNNPWDVFDAPGSVAADPAPNGQRNKAVSIADVIAVVSYIGTFNGDAGSPSNSNGVRYDSLKDGDWFNSTTGFMGPDGAVGPDDKAGLRYDRTASTTAGQPWRSGPPNGAVSIQDALVALNQVGTNCN